MKLNHRRIILSQSFYVIQSDLVLQNEVHKNLNFELSGGGGIFFCVIMIVITFLSILT